MVPSQPGGNFLASLPLVLLGLVIFSPPLFGHEGAVPSNAAFVQFVRQEPAKAGNGSNFFITIKAKQAGSYVVVAGYLHSQSKLWFSGFFSGTPFWKATVVTMDAGDTITIQISNVAVPPTGALIYDAAIYYSLEDMKKHR